jgi:hypothetical protein
MPCNWELYELRVVIYLRGTKIPITGNFLGETQWEFFNVSVNLSSLGIAGFQGNGLSCNFKSVFSQLANLRKLPFGFTSERIRSNRLNFGNLEEAYKKGLTLGAAKLYVHRRDLSDFVSSAVGPGILLEIVTLDSATKTANTVNF